MSKDNWTRCFWENDVGVFLALNGAANAPKRGTSRKTAEAEKSFFFAFGAFILRKTCYITRL